ncbi:hypothetical protein RHA1_ro00746 [Rhodococcus jostii RHA1]|uniref:Uncharacterized protein n=1 Tax=Rhodococcus jostii (strain RHA1) TaxID=101510 RepID=Q0SIQ5_RHOJR|nr:hypothetical protein RHA1_ro00746 [Rhodococcus jostii RHA1]
MIWSVLAIVSWTATQDATVPLDHAHIQHDFALTEHYYVFVLAPIILDPVKAMLGLSTAEAATRPARGRHQDHPCPPRRW